MGIVKPGLVKSGLTKQGFVKPGGLVKHEALTVVKCCLNNYKTTVALPIARLQAYCSVGGILLG